MTFGISKTGVSAAKRSSGFDQLGFASGRRTQLERRLEGGVEGVARGSAVSVMRTVSRIRPSTFRASETPAPAKALRPSQCAAGLASARWFLAAQNR